MSINIISCVLVTAPLFSTQNVGGQMHNLLEPLFVSLLWNISETDALAGFRLSLIFPEGEN